MGDTAKKKALIYSPYLKGIGGGERYCLTVAEYFLQQGWEVDLFWDKYKEIEKIGQKLDLNIKGIRVIKRKPEEISRWQKFRLTIGYDLVFWLSDGSIPFLFARKNLLHFQQPFISVNGSGFFNQIKLSFVDWVICNSKFTKRFVDKEYGVNSLVLYPPADIEKFQPKKKENIILAVGRFEKSKKQEVMIDAFKEMVDKGLKGWQFVLIGGSLGGEQLLKGLKKKAEGYPVKFMINASFKKVQEHLGKAKIFWHAKGYGVEERKEPWLVEHFGITPVEAMAAGCVPVVMDKGGLKEIVRRGVGERWNTKGELKRKTFKLIKDNDRYQRYQATSLVRAKRFSKQIFYQRLEKILASK